MWQKVHGDHDHIFEMLSRSEDPSEDPGPYKGILKNGMLQMPPKTLQRPLLISK